MAGCSSALHRRREAFALLGRQFARALEAGGAIPSTAVAAGELVDVVLLDAVAMASDARPTINTALAATRTRPTLVVVPPRAAPWSLSPSPVGALGLNDSGAPDPSRYWTVRWTAADNYLMAYGAKFKPTSAQYVRMVSEDIPRIGLFGGDFVVADADNVGTHDGRFEQDTTTDPAKAGTGQYTNSESFWTYFLGSPRTGAEGGFVADDLIVADAKFIGGRGFRASNVHNALFDGLIVERTVSDAIQVFNSVNDLTIQNCRVSAGDDGISVIGCYNANLAWRDPYPPTDVLVRNNVVSDCRSRGLSIHGAKDCVFEDNVVNRSVMAGIIVTSLDYSAGSPSHAVQDCIFRRNHLIRPGLLNNTTNNPVPITVLANSSQEKRVAVDASLNEQGYVSGLDISETTIWWGGDGDLTESRSRAGVFVTKPTLGSFTPPSTWGSKTGYYDSTIETPVTDRLTV